MATHRMFGRSVRLVFGAHEASGDEVAEQAGTWGRQVEGLRMQFRVTKTLATQPNALELSVWNLSPASRARAAEKGAKVLLSAGYQDRMGLLFVGELDVVTHERRGADWVTHMQAGDGLTAARLGRVFEAMAPGQIVQDVVRRMAEQLKVGLGNAMAQLSKGKPGAALTGFVNGVVFEGSVHEQFNRLMRSLGYDWSVQDGQLLLTERDGADDRQAVVLAPDSGLIGSPLMAVRETQAGRRDVVRCRSLLNPDIAPGRALRVEGEALEAWCRVESVQHIGDTHGQEWNTDIEAAPL